MKPTKTVLIVDDESEVLETLRLSFAEDLNFQYEVETYKTPGECLHLVDTRFDVCVVDLGFWNPNSFPGFNLLIGLSCIRDGGAAFVYSGFPDLENVVLAMQLGATAFYDKKNYPPHEFVKAVDGWLKEQEQKAQEDEIIASYILDRSAELTRDYAGKVVGIDVRSGKPEVAASGNSRLEMLLEYQKVYDKHHASGQADGRSAHAFPYIHQVPASLSRGGI